MPSLPAGPARDAMVSALNALDAAEQHPDPLVMSIALAKVAHCCSKAGALPQAERYLQRALRWAMTLGAADASVDLVCELAELAVRRADSMAGHDAAAVRAAREQARDRCFEAAGLASRSADPHWEVHVLLRVSDVLDRCGDHDDAISLQCRALHLLVSDGLSAAEAAFPSLTADQAIDRRQLM
jgi:hypothetical protein